MVLISILIVSIMSILSFATDVNAQTGYKETANDKKKLFKVISVIDAETIKVSIRGKEETVKLLGVNTNSTQCSTKETLPVLKKYVEKKYIKLSDDIIAGKKDKKGNLLRYVYLSDNKATFINGELVKQGLSCQNTTQKIIKTEKFNKYTEYAKTKTLGMWDKKVIKTVKQFSPTAVPVKKVISYPTKVPTVAPQPIKQEPVHEQPSYSGGDKDCGDFGTHAEAQAFFIANGGPGSDPHRLDGNNDGIACEKLP